MFLEPTIENKGPGFGVWTGREAVRFSGELNVKSLVDFVKFVLYNPMGEEGKFIPILTPDNRGKFMLDESGMEELQTSSEISFIKFSPPSCGLNCLVFDHFWTTYQPTKNEEDPLIKLWLVNCEDHSNMCAERGIDMTTSNDRPVFQAWNGLHFEEFVGVPPIPPRNVLFSGGKNVAGRYWILHFTLAMEAFRVYGQTLEFKSSEGIFGGFDQLGWAEQGEFAEKATAINWWPAVQQRALAMGGEQLDRKGKAFRISNFLSDEEVDYIIELGLVTKGGAIPCDVSAQDPILQAIEWRLSNLTGIAPHADEEMLLQSRWPSEYDSNNLFHHDTNKRSRRVATVIMYLRGAEDESNGKLIGGDTLLPCLEPLLAGDERISSCAEVAEAHKNGVRNIVFDTPIYREAYQMCELEDYGVRVTPYRGTALLFAADDTPEALNPLPETWHKGCHLRSGVKMMMTKFKARRMTPETEEKAFRGDWMPTAN